MRKVPIDTGATKLLERIRTQGAGFAKPLQFANMDEFWNLETALVNLKLPCVVVEFVQAEGTVVNRDVLQIDMLYRLNYLCQVPSTGEKRSTLLAGTRALAECFTGGEQLDGNLTWDEPGIDQAEVDLGPIVLNPGLSEKNIGWGIVPVTIRVLSSNTGA